MQSGLMICWRMALVTASMRRPRLQLEQRGLDAVGHGARAYCHLAGDFFGGEALSHPQQCFQLTGSQRLAELANP